MGIRVPSKGLQGHPRYRIIEAYDPHRGEPNIKENWKLHGFGLQYYTKLTVCHIVVSIFFSIIPKKPFGE